ncbi:hypothetical protein PK36_gp55 [Geobacillus phage vB_GthS_PK3.6]|nr:hypothetical protein PK36_gp55 [Geobacillus phage vB_GthS_PK3.6]
MVHRIIERGMRTMVFILRHPNTHGEIKTTDERKAKYLQEIGYVLVNEYDLTKADKVKE